MLLLLWKMFIINEDAFLKVALELYEKKENIVITYQGLSAIINFQSLLCITVFQQVSTEGKKEMLPETKIGGQ